MQRHHPHMPFLVTAAAVALFSLMDALMKHASIAIGAYSALLLRSIIGTAIMVPLWRMRGGNWPAPGHLRIHILRALVSGGMALLFFHALTLLPMAEAVALSFISPLFALYLAAVMLGERISGKAVMASALGLGGVILISMVRFQSDVPSGQSLEGIAAVLVSAGLYAWNLVLQRQIAQIAPPADIALSQHAITALVLLLFAPWLAVAPATSELTILFLAAILATISLLLMAWSYARAEAQALVPVEYSGFLWAALFGWLFFAENVEIPTLVGGALIVVGCWIAAPRSEPEQMAA
ncbi:permease [Croceicoccus estronivorus]|nr:permease [Croceicoccus estronivorus]